ncbi:hypothetical protein CE91St36_03330 [Christensenellaceae bacterium]|nr:hypothetical protein CE91St36_03330 [Christensenellaceae bacterium]BDF60184.1 hypothetical protein CE91St37_03340 [Christensenellaceae bacterium]
MAQGGIIDNGTGTVSDSYGENNIIGIPGSGSLSDLQTIMQAETLPIGGNNYIMGQLQTNGGATKTVMLSPGSPALDNIPTAIFGGWPSSSTVDQRDMPRPDASNANFVDIGAVEVQQVVSIAITSPPTHLNVEQNQTLAYTTVPATPEAFGGVTWSSSNPNVLAIDPQTGTLTAKNPGSAVITVTTANGKTATCVIMATQPVTSVAINEGPQMLQLPNATAMSVMAPGFSYTATVSPADYSTKNLVTWASSDPAVASIDANGNVTAKSAGTTEITAGIVDEYNNNKTTISAPVQVTVSSNVIPVTGVTLNVDNTTVLVGKAVQLTATVVPDNATNKSLTWQSDDTSIAIVDANGLVKGMKSGVATITVTTGNGNYTATCTVTVTAVSSTSAQTGDSTNQNCWVLLALCSIITIYICIRKRPQRL